MNESDVLLTLAEVAVAFAGFASLVGILGRGTSKADPRVLSLRMRAMLLTSLLVVGFSLFPVILDWYGWSDRGEWIGSSLALLLTNGVYFYWLEKGIRTLGRAGLTPSLFQRRVIIPTLLLTLLVVSVLLVVNLFIWSPAPYLTALALLLFQSGFAFCLIVFSFLPRISVDEDPRL